MSTVFSKNKEKRSRSSSSEANNSFVKNVTSRVSGLLPATITKWFSSPSSSNANGSAPTADATDSSTEDEAPETQPPPKRMRISSLGKYSHFTPTDSNCSPTSKELSNESSGRHCAFTFRREANYVSTPVRAPNEETVIERSERDSTMFKSQHSVSSTGPSVATKRKSLFDTPPNREASMRALKTTASNKVVDPKAPCFKPSLLGSPFYPGHTMYGGASMYINQPNIKQRKVALVNESKSSDNTTMSHSARRVMDLLENYSSPLMEAKRLSQLVKNARSESTKNESLDSTTISGSPYANKSLSYKTQELHVPNIATILRLKQRSRLMDTTNAARQIIASHSSTMHDYNIQPYPSSNTQKDSEKDSGKMTTKVKTRLTRQNRGDKIETDDQLMPVNLPTAVLQIDKDNLPKFTFGNITQTSTSDSVPTTIPKFTFTPSTASLPVSGSQSSIKTGDAALSKPETVLTNDSYKFSSPVRISGESHQISSTLPKFTFGSPERGVDKPKTDKKKDDDSSIVVGTSKDTEKLSVPKSKDWQCPDCWVNNKADIEKCVCCGAKQPTKGAKATKCTVCKLADSQSNSEKCVNCDKVQLNNNATLSVLKPTDSSKWKCEDCWVSNDENLDKCQCCGGKNPKSKAVSVSTQSFVISAANSEWKCDDCWIKNKDNVNKCAACGAAKPGSKPASNPVVSSNDLGSSMFKLPDNNLNNLVKSQNDKWECSSCLVRNENNRTKCVCCESDKPGLVKESDKKLFNFGMATNTSFKFGIDPKLQESSSVKVPEVKASEKVVLSKLAETETNNNILPKTPTFSFGIPAKKDDDQKDAPKDNKTAEPPKVGGFTFGIPKVEKKTEAVAPPVFGSTTKLTEPVLDKPNVEKEKPQEVPKVDFNFSSSKDSSLNSMFASPINAQVNKDKNVGSSSALLSQLVSPENKEITSAPLLLQQNATTSEPVKQNSTFTFSGLGNASNLFAAPASTAASFTLQSASATTVASVPMFQKPETTSAPALSMFQKPNPTTTSTISLFPKSETITTAAPPSMSATAPIFSFGSNTAQSAAPAAFGGNGIPSATPPAFGSNGPSAAPAQTEKPKFNFSFGGNTPLFNNTTFSAAPDNTNNSNKFGITGNSLGGNGLPAVNSLSGNSLTSGKLGGEMSTSPLSQSTEMAPAPSLFGAPAKDNNMWSSTNNSSANLFATSAPTNSMQKPATFTFGSFNSSSTTPAFGTNSAPAQNMFGMNQNASAQPSMFASPVQNQPAPSMFGTPQPSANRAPTMQLFGTPNVGAAPTFGTPNPPITAFEAPSLNPTPAPAFNFGAPQTTGVFGFGQQPQQPQQPPQPQMPQAVYSFGATPGAPQVQFNMGSAPNTGVRRVRKAVRRNPQR